MDEKLSGIVVGGVNYGDNDRILNIFSLEKGMISAKIKGVKKATAKLKFAAEPFCFAEFVFSRRGAFRTVTGASLLDSFYPLREDIVKYFCGATILEFIKHFQQEGILAPELFLHSVEGLKTLAYGKENPKSALVKYLVKALSLVGYGLNTEGCFHCGSDFTGRAFFDYQEGAFLCEECQTEFCREINFSTYTAIRWAVNGQELEEFLADKALRLIDFYLVNKTEEKLNSLKELIKMGA